MRKLSARSTLPGAIKIVAILVLTISSGSCAPAEVQQNSQLKENGSISSEAERAEAAKTEAAQRIEAERQKLGEELTPVLSSLTPEARENILRYPLDFLRDTQSLLQIDPDLLVLVDKKRSLPAEYSPVDLVELVSLIPSKHLFRQGLSLRSEAAKALSSMMEAASKQNITIIAQSTYRSYASQAAIYQNNVKTLGQEAADRESAKPGTSQHQLGLALDFSPIEDDFAQTPAYSWLLTHAQEYGFSLSYPPEPLGESLTGYRFEPWHWRYIGVDAAHQQAKWYADSQQLMLEILHLHRRTLEKLVQLYLQN